MKILTSGLFTLALVELTSATNYYVRKTGNDSQNGLTPATAWKTVTKAANYTLQPGDTVFIGPGYYNESLSPTTSGTENNPIVWYGDYTGRKTTDAPGRVAIGGWSDGVPQFVPQTRTHNGFRFTLENIVDNQDGTSSIFVTVTNGNQGSTNWIACSLPPGVTALWPLNNTTYTSPAGRSFSVVNPTNNPFYSIRFNGAIPKNQSDLFQYKLTTPQVNALTAVRVSAKASSVTGDVTLPIIYLVPEAIQYANACNIDSKNNLVLCGITFGKTSSKGINLSNASNIVVRDCDILETASYGIYIDGWATSGAITCEADSILCGNVGGIYANLSWPSSPPTFNIVHNVITSSGRGIYIKTANVEKINSNFITNCSSQGIYLNWIFNQVPEINSNQIINCSSSGIYIERATVGEIAHNQLIQLGGHGIYVMDNTGTYTIGSIAYNQIAELANSSAGIYVDRVNCAGIKGNTISAATAAGITYNGGYSYSVGEVDSNLVGNCTGYGIDITNAVQIGTLRGNIIYNIPIGISTTSGSYYQIGAFKDNRIFSYSSRGISCNRLQNTVIENNLLYRCTGVTGTYGIYGFCVQGIWRNNIVVGTKYGIYSANFSGAPASVTAQYNCTFNNDINYYGVIIGSGCIYDDPLFVDPDGADDILGDAGWADDDFHLQSTGGSWHFGAWTPDAEDSPCVDAGHPDDDYSVEPEDNGDRINIGCYGNTAQASKKRLSPITIVYPNFPSNKWVMLGVPVAPTEGNPPGEPLTIFGDDLGTNTPGDWYLIHWVTNDSTMEYFEYNDGTIYQPPTPYPGLGYFLWQNKYPTVNLDVYGRPVNHCRLEVAQAPWVSYQSSYGTALGFNQFANPYEFTIDWSNTEIWKYPNRQWDDNQKETLTLQSAADQGIISRYAYIWNHNLDQYEVVVPNGSALTDTLSVWQGFYFIQIDSISNLKLNIPRRRIATLKKSEQVAQMLTAQATKYPFRSSSIAPEWQWFLKLGVELPTKKLRDTENGLGVASNARDDFDGWDAFDLRGISSTGQYVQLEFVHRRGPTFAYDLRPDFSQSSTWKFRVNTSKANLKQVSRLVWPHIRLVPESIRFSLLAGDSMTVLVDDLRKATNYEYKITDSVMTFFIRATKVSDSQAPQFKFVFHQNPLLPQDLTFYIVPSEPLAQITAQINSTAVSLREVDTPPNVYYGKHFLQGSGVLQIDVTGKDKAGNAGGGTATLQFQLAKAQALSKLTDVTSGLELTIPAGALAENTLVCLARGALDVEPLVDALPVGEPIYLGPAGLQPQKPLLFHFDQQELNQRCVLYRYENGSWHPVGLAQAVTPVVSAGIYQIFEVSSSVAANQSLPTEFALEACYPNPFNSSITISYALPTFGKVEIKIYDLLGREVRDLGGELRPAGHHQIVWDGSNNYGSTVATGIYYLKMTVRDGQETVFRSTRKITLVK